MSLGCTFLCQRYDKIGQLYAKGKKRLDDDLRIDKLLLTVKHLKTAVENLGINGKRWHYLKHAQENIIDLDSGESEIEVECD